MKTSVTTALWGSVGMLLLLLMMMLVFLPDPAMTDSHHREVRQVSTTCSTTGKILSNTSCCGILFRPSLFSSYYYLMSANEISGRCCRDRFTYGSTANFTYTYSINNYPNRCFCDTTLPACHAPAQDPCMAGSNMVKVDDSTGQCGKLTVSGSNVNYTWSPQEKSGVCCRLNAMADGQSVPNALTSVSKLPGSCYCGSGSTASPSTTSQSPSAQSVISLPPTSAPSSSLPPDSSTPAVSTTPPSAFSTLPPTTPSVSITPLPSTPPVATTPPVTTAPPPTTGPVSTAPPAPTTLPPTTLLPTTPPVSVTLPPSTPPVSTTLPPSTPPASTTPLPTTPPVSTTLLPTTPVSTTPPPTTPPVSITPLPTTPPVSTTLPPTTPLVSTTPPPTTLPPTTLPASTTSLPTIPPASTTLPPTTPLASTTLPPTTPPASTTLPPTTPADSTTPPASTSPPPTTNPPSTTTPVSITSTTASTTTTAPSCTLTKTPVAATRNKTCCGSLTVYTSFNLAYYTFSKQEKSGSCCRLNPVSSTQTALQSLTTYPGDCYCDKALAPECFDACPVPGFARMVGGTVLTDPCARPGIVTLSTAEIPLACHGVYIYDPAGPVSFLPVLYVPSSCVELFSQLEAYMLYGKSANETFSWTDQVLPLESPAAGISAFLPAPTIMDPLQAACAGPACAYNPANMSSLITFTGCKLYSYGYTLDANGAPTYTGEFRSANVAPENPATCQSNTANAVTVCWKFTDASTSLCSADTGAPVYCPLATGEWVLYGLLDLVNTCGTTASFAVIPIFSTA